MNNSHDRALDILGVISKIGKSLLSSDDVSGIMQAVMCELGLAFNIDRVYVFKNYIDNETGYLYTSQFVEWVKGSIAPQINNSDLQGVSYEESLPRWRELLSKSEYVVGNVKDFPKIERDVLEPQGIVSLLAVPIFVKNTFWGFVGFDDCVNEAQFTDLEIMALTIASEMISSFIIRYQTQVDLELNEQRWYNALEGSGEGVWDYYVNEKRIFVSNRGKELLHLETKGNYINIDDCTYTDFGIENTNGFFVEIFNSMDNLSYHEYHHVIDGKIFWFATKGSVISRDILGQPTRIVGTFSDITERKNLDNKLKDALALAENANKAKSSFLASMSHEIRTPLNGMVGFLHLLTEHITSDTGKEYIRIIENSTSTLLNIINSILDLSKVETGGIVLESSEYSFVDEMEAIARLFSATAFEKGIFLRTYIDYKLPRLIEGDQLRLRQILSNLLNNALKFTPKDGFIFFEVSLLEATNKHTQIRFSIKDTGIGISKEYQKDIFKPFTQADTSITRKYGGSGLGLSIAKEFIALMGSEIQIESVVDKGSNFYFTLTFPATEAVDVDFTEIYDIAFLEIPSCTWSLDMNLQAVGCNTFLFDNVEELIKQDLSKYYAVVVSVFYTTQPIIDVLQKIRNNNNNIPIMLFTYPVDVSVFDVLNSMRIKIKIRPFSMKRLRKALTSLVDIKDSQSFTANALDATKFNGTVLVAEDNFINAKLIDIVLKKYGLNVKLVANGKEAIEEYERNKYDIILMDINMPIMDGISATKIIRQKERDSKIKRTPIVALTANVMKDDAETFITSGMDCVLNKPIVSAALEEVFRKYLH